jgi:hypothetical protein
MNSAQRRKQNREQPHVIIIHTETNHPYFEHDEKILAAVKWCKKKCKGSWSVDTRWDHAEFKFSEHKDATIFGLKWI